MVAFPEIPKNLADALADLKAKTNVSGKDLSNIFDLADKLGIKFHFKISSEKFAEITLEGTMTAADEKFTVGSVDLTLKILH